MVVSSSAIATLRQLQSPEAKVATRGGWGERATARARVMLTGCMVVLAGLGLLNVPDQPTSASSSDTVADAMELARKAGGAVLLPEGAECPSDGRPIEYFTGSYSLYAEAQDFPAGTNPDAVSIQGVKPVRISPIFVYVGDNDDKRAVYCGPLISNTDIDQSSETGLALIGVGETTGVTLNSRPPRIIGPEDMMPPVYFDPDTFHTS
jgi:hypothetical protein